MPTAKPSASTPGDTAERHGHRARLLLRSRMGAFSAGVSWPVTSSRAVPVALLLAPRRFASTSRAERAIDLASDAGVVVVDLCCGGTHPHPAGRIDETEMAAAAHMLRWLADHAPELGGDPGAIVVVSIAGAHDTATVVTAGAQADGWPPVAGHVHLGRLDRSDEGDHLPRSDLTSRIVAELRATLGHVAGSPRHGPPALSQTTHVAQ